MSDETAKAEMIGVTINLTLGEIHEIVEGKYIPDDMINGIKRMIVKECCRYIEGPQKMFKIKEQLAAKLAGIIVHTDEYLGPEGCNLDIFQVQMALLDSDVWQFVADVGALAPRPRGLTYSSIHIKEE